MTEPVLDDLVASIHNAPGQMVLAATGGGSRAIWDLLSVAGASRSVLEATVPYAAAALADYLGAPPEHSCSQRAARAMAMAALERALRYSQAEPPFLAGVACTASLASDRPKRGSHRVHVAVQTADYTEAWSLELEKGRRSRREEEDVCARLLLNAVCLAKSLDERAPLPLTPSEQVMVQRQEAQPEWTELLLGRQQAVATGRADAQPAELLFPGAFNPLHDGHREMIAVAERLTGRPAALEISVLNVDKPPLDFIEIGQRLAGLAGRPVWLTRAATFAEKARLFPGAIFIVGADTAQRIGNPKYYNDQPATAQAAIDEIGRHGCRFLVFGRKVGEQFQTLSQLNLPPALAQLCQEVPEEVFHRDVSSTELRTDG